jgi:U32 family peptidase
MKRKIELLAPGGNIDSIKTAILAGSDAVYCGLNKFNARNRAANISFDDLLGVLRLAHKNNCKVFLTLNIIILDSEIPALIKLLNRLVNTTIDGVIIQDLGLFYLLSKYFKGLKIHASTQLTTHNFGQIKFLRKLNAERVNLSRELSIQEIKALTAVAHINRIQSEVFVHGSYCISFSGICYMSSVQGGNSGNRGRCSQPCREKYLKTPVGKEYPLNLKDNSAYLNLNELYNAGVDSLKIEGRIKEFEYVYRVVNSWKKQISHFYTRNSLINDNTELYKVFNRDFSNGFLKADINKNMFIENPMSHSIKQLSVLNNYSSKDQLTQDQTELREEKENLKKFIINKIETFDLEKIPLTIKISGKCGNPLGISVHSPDTSFMIFSFINLVDVGSEAISYHMMMKRLKAINDTEYIIKHMELNLDGELYLPYKELTSLKKRLLYLLNGSKEFIPPVNIPVLKKSKNKVRPTLSVLISSFEDADICQDASIDVYFQLPNTFKNEIPEYLDLFEKNKRLMPWFPSILIGADFKAAIKILDTLKPKRIVTDNTGIAFEAYEKEISWIAGPKLNLANSYSLICLKENFNCNGAFLSNELSKTQSLSLKVPEDFNLYYSIYHPVELMTSRQCLFHQVIGCEKNKIDESCIPNCEKQSFITNKKNDTFIISKTKGNYHTVYSAANLLNTEIVKDKPDLFSGFFIDLREIYTETSIELDKISVIELFKSHLSNNADSLKELKRHIHPTVNNQYKQGF